MKLTFTVEVENDYEAEKLKRRFAMLTNPDWIAIWWSIDDVLGQSKGWDDDEEPTITEDEAREIAYNADGGDFSTDEHGDWNIDNIIEVKA